MIGLGHLLLPLFLAALDIISTAAALLLSAYLRFDVIVPEKIFRSAGHAAAVIYYTDADVA